MPTGDMAFQLTRTGPVGDAITRIVKRQIKKSRTQLAKKNKRRKRKAPAKPSAARAVRKHFKKVRSALRLVREGLGEDVYRQENSAFRDAGRLLAGLCDAEMLVATLDRLKTERFPTAAGRDGIAMIRKALRANRKEVSRRLLEDGKAFAAVEEFVTRAMARVRHWNIEEEEWAALSVGFGRAYQQGHRALASAKGNPSVEHLHEWRKQAKYLWHELQLLEPRWTSSEKTLRRQVHKLSQLLGVDHDLAVLRETLAAEPITFGGHRVLKSVFAVVDRRRKAIKREAFALGRMVYEETPVDFLNRTETNFRGQARRGTAGGTVRAPT
jgi:CHAD domain-containing protein